MKYFVSVIFVAFLLAGCIGQEEEPVYGRFVFPNTPISLQVPESWQQTKIPGNNYPILFGSIEYGIKPNIRLEKYSKATDISHLKNEYLDSLANTYPEIEIKGSSACPIKVKSVQCNIINARRVNNDNTPIIHSSYFISNGDVSFVMSGTCSEPSYDKLRITFNNIVQSIEIK